MQVVVAELNHPDQVVSVCLGDEPAGPTGQGAQQVVPVDDLLQGVDGHAVALVHGQRLQLGEGVGFEDLPPDLVIESVNKLELGVSQMLGTIENLMNSFCVNVSSSSIQELQVN